MAQSWCETTASGRSKGSRDRRDCQLWPGCPLKRRAAGWGELQCCIGNYSRAEKATACAHHCPAAEMQPTVPLESFDGMVSLLTALITGWSEVENQI